MELGQSVQLEGRYGQEPRVESVTMLRNDLYRRIEHDVRDWINERRFIPRFLLSAAAFLVVYLFLAIVIRDPLPVIDEILIALGVSVVAYIAVGRRFEQSRVASQRRVTLRSMVDGVVFSEDQPVRELETLLQELETLPWDEEPTAELHERARAVWTANREIAAQAIEHLQHLMAIDPYRTLYRQMRKKRVGRKLRERVEAGTVAPGAVHLLAVLRKGAP